MVIQTQSNFALANALPAHRVESGREFLTFLGERMSGALAGAGEIEAVVAAFPRAGVEAHAAQRLGKLRIFLAGIGTNHDNACSRSYLRNAIIAHGECPIVRLRGLSSLRESRPFYQTTMLRAVYHCDYDACPRRSGAAV